MMVPPQVRPKSTADGYPRWTGTGVVVVFGVAVVDASRISLLSLRIEFAVSSENSNHTNIRKNMIIKHKKSLNIVYLLTYKRRQSYR